MPSSTEQRGEGDKRDIKPEEKAKEENKIASEGPKDPAVKNAERKGHVDEEKEELDEDQNRTIEEVCEGLKCGKDGLSSSDAEGRLTEYGQNVIEEKKQNPVLQFLGFMWNPLAWAMEVAAIASVILGDYLDFGLILGLLFVNSCISFFEEHNASSAIAELKNQLAPTADVKRDGKWQSIEAAKVVPGDVYRIKLGDIIVADGKILAAHGQCKVDQAALTGESLPANKKVGDVVYSGSGVKQGDMELLVTKTGEHTFFGKATALLQETGEEGHFQRVLRSIGFFCISFIAVFVLVELLVTFLAPARGYPCAGVHECYNIDNSLVLIVGGVPIAMPTVLSVTMAIGAYKLSKKQAIVSRLTAVEELAAMDILCSDKTGTLTQNKLTVDQPFCVEGVDAKKVQFDAALACKRDAEGSDAIDDALIKFNEDKEGIAKWEVLEFIPFNSETKRAESTVKNGEGKTIKVTKGAPQIILEMSRNQAEISDVMEKKIDEFAMGGYRALGVAINETPNDEKGWFMEGVIPMSDPPREDTKHTIEELQKKGIRVKMVTGDQTAIAKEIARRIGMGDNILKNATISKMDTDSPEFYKLIDESDGFAQVLPENKYNIVKALQGRHHTVGMTGDGANDAPALKRADIGIAVEGATSAARAAADIVLVAPGLSVIADAVYGARQIFQRMQTYTIYAVTSTVRLVMTFFFLTVCWNFYFPTLITIILAVCNDGTMISIAKDRVLPSDYPDTWNLQVVFGKAIIIGGYLTGSTIVLFALVYNCGFLYNWFDLPSLLDNQVRMLIYLNISVTGLGTIFSVRNQHFFFSNRPGVLPVIAFLIAQAAASCMAAYGFRGYPYGPYGLQGCGWGWVLFVWLWSIAILLPIDFVKLGAEDVMRAIPQVNVPSNFFHNMIKKLPWRTRDNLNKHVLSEHYHHKPHFKTTGTRETKFAAADVEHRRSIQINRATSGKSAPPKST
ncbi:P-type ATPase [Planoprotostelium fungivorum]|uniref:Plasma membrane ATPase n=1 Tax=Planoprotostelium fungivorum TaxID=1890364 RepID=A0A2P6NRH2_9EUKA|nr:P-type ATPase [Planoprotostelium fungivorum]